MRGAAKLRQLRKWLLLPVVIAARPARSWPREPKTRRVRQRHPQHSCAPQDASPWCQVLQGFGLRCMGQHRTCVYQTLLAITSDMQHAVLKASVIQSLYILCIAPARLCLCAFERPPTNPGIMRVGSGYSLMGCTPGGHAWLPLFFTPVHSKAFVLAGSCTRAQHAAFAAYAF